MIRFTERGQALVEFTLVLPLLLLIVLGLFDLGYAVFINNMLENAAREGARTGVILESDDATIRDQVRATAPSVTLTDAQIQIVPSPYRTYREPITVTVTYPYQPLTPVVGNLSPGGFNLSASSVMIVEGVY